MSEEKSRNTAYSRIPFVSTKLNIPKACGNHIHRNHLIEQLDQALRDNVRLILLSAPPGYGKSSLLSSWVQNSLAERQDIHHIWLTLDEFDNDFRRFTSYLLTAVSESTSEAAEEIRLILNSEHDLSSYDILAILINALEKTGISQVFIIEDYHLIENQAVHQLMNKLLDYLPENVTLAISSRMDLPFPVSRYRSAGQLVEVRAADLKFSEDEIFTFLRSNDWNSLSAEHIRAVSRRTEGWPASLRLFILAGENEEQLTESIHVFSGAQNFLADYFTDEVLDRQPRDVQQFLLQTAILKEFTADLCQAVTQLAASPQLLQTIRESNLFLVSLDDENRWFRYHRLFLDLLQYKLRLQGSKEIMSLHKRAAEWFFEHGQMEPAVDHALLSGDYQTAVAWITPYLSELWELGRLTTIAAFVERIPEPERYESIDLTMMYIRSLCQLGEVQKAKVCLRVSQLDQSPLSEPEMGRLEYLKATFALYAGDIPSTIVNLTSAIERFTADDLEWRSSAYTLLGAALGWGGKLEQSTAAYKKAVDLGQKWGKPYFSLEAGFRLVSNLYQMGKLQDAKQIIGQMIQYADVQQLANLSVIGTFWALMGTIDCQQNQLVEAKKSILKGVRIAETGNRIISTGLCFLNAINFYFSIGESATVGVLIQKTEKLSTYSPLPSFMQDWIEAAKIRYYLLIEEVEKAREVANKHGGILNEPIEMTKFELYFALIRFAIADHPLPLEEEDFHIELQCIEHLKLAARPQGLKTKLIQTLIIEACLHHELLQAGEVTLLLQEALSLAADERMVRSFIENGKVLFPYLQEIAQNTQDEFAIDLSQNILVALDEKSYRKVGLLSTREREVLSFLPSHLSEKEIASALSVSTSTAHTHIKNIYQKLGVHTRSDAVLKARNLHLFD